MAVNNRIVVKKLIQSCESTEEANKIIEKYAGHMTVKEKIAFMKGMFGAEIIDQQPEDSDELVYEILLNAAILGD